MGDTDNAPNGEILNLLRDIVAQNKEIKQDIKEIKQGLEKHTETIEKLKSKINELEIENSEVKKKLFITQRKIKKNNIVVFGLADDEETDIKIQIKDLATNRLGIALEEIDIDNIYRIGTKKGDKPRAVIVEFVRNIKKQEIFKNVTKLKGSGISIANDLAPEEIEEKKILLRHLKLAREKKYNATITKNILVINGEKYTSEDLKNLDSEDATECYRHRGHYNNSNSAPATPTTSKTAEVKDQKKNNKEEIIKVNKVIEEKNENKEKQSRKQTTTTESIGTRSMKKSVSDTDTTILSSLTKKRK